MVTTAKSNKTTNGQAPEQDLDHELLAALRAARRGDFSIRIQSHFTGRDGEIAEAFNDLVELNEGLTNELRRVAQAVGREGKVNERVSLAAAKGSWSRSVDAVNELVNDISRPRLEAIRVLEAVAQGDLSQRFRTEIDGTRLRGEFLRYAKVVNSMVDELNEVTSELMRVASEVGTEGKLGGQANVRGLSGTWRELTYSVNLMAGNLTAQVRNIADVTTAVANGDLSRKITVDVHGEILELKDTINTMVDQLNSFASEVTRVAREVGTEGKLGGQANVPGVAGTWKDLTDSVNSMASNLTDQVRNIADVTTAVANGDLSRKVTVDVRGEILELKNTVNTMVDQLNAFASEVTRVAREVGTEGKLGGQANVHGVEGTWRELTDSVNSMATNLTAQVRNIAEVTTAVANGDLSKKITVDVQGEILELKITVNTMVDQLNAFASEVTRVAREVGSEGILGGQADVHGVAGTWRELTDSVNFMAGNLTAQVRNIAEVTTAVANGDLSRKITVDVRGEILELKNTINTMVDQLNAFASEVTRVAREVGTEGKLGGQANVRGVAGTWKDLTDSVNSMAGNLTAQVRNIADVTTAVANGDLSRKITVDVQGELLELKDTINTMVDQLNAFASEVTRVAREVGTEGKLGGQANVRGVAGTWKDLTDSVNSMAGNLTGQVRNIADVTTAVANGDLSRKITVDVQGEILELKDTINTMVDQLNAFASEVTRVAREVGTEGKLGGQANVPGVAGTWKDLTDSVNSMAGNLTGQVRNIAEVTTAVANGDLSKKITVDVQGEILELKYTINTMVDQLNAFASEVTRVAREVGTEGKLGGQADVRGVAGTWKDLTDSVNSMAGNLTGQVRNIADVTTAVANGDLSRKITVDVQGEILELKDTINTMVDQLNAFASEVTRVAREVGSEGRLGGQANVPGVAGTWKDLTDSVNSMASNLTGQVRNIANVTTAVASGDLSKKITVDVRGEILELKDTINTMVDQLNAFASEVTRVAREVGSEGRLGGQANVPGVAGTWKDLTDSVNSMASNLTGQVRNIAAVTTAVANGDLSKKITVDVRGEILELKDTINTMVDQLNAFASEVTRVAREVGSEGRLGGQATVRGVGGTWKDLTDSVNSMAGNLTEQVRGIARVVTAVANGDLKRKVTFEAKGEIAELAETINSMTDTLAIFAEQVTTVAREVGIEGQLGGQANVPGAAGTWRDLTDNVNQLAANLTTQVRAIADVATAVTSGDLSQSIEVEAQGEVDQLRDNINKMIRNLRDTTQQNREQDWLKTNLARFSGMLSGQRDLQTVGRMILSELASVVGVQRAVFYFAEEGQPMLRLLASYAAEGEDRVPQRIALGEGLIGQCAVERRRMVIENVPSGYAAIGSAIGSAPPFNVVVLPVLFEGDTKGVIELASFEALSETQLYFFDQLMEIIGIVLNTLVANSRTEDLLKQSQALATELQQTNRELQEKARQLSEQNEEVERRRREIDEARAALEQKAEQLAQTSRYKSQFLANMSHELRTPLNSLLILSQQLSDNPEGNLTERQVSFAETIRAAGHDLLTLINDILDLSKIESGTTSLDVGRVRFEDIQDDVERTFRQLAQQKALDFAVHLSPDLPSTLTTDPTRLQQIIKNLLSNAFKFTETGFVSMAIEPVETGWSLNNESLNRARSVVAFSVADSGVGIPPEKQSVIFEAFQQADMDTSRRYGGTGLGLSISREIAQLLGGEIALVSAAGAGSTFTLYLPILYEPAAERALSMPAQPAAVLAAPNGANRETASTLPTEEPDPAWAVEPRSFRLDLDDDRPSLEAEDGVILVVDDRRERAMALIEAVHAAGYKALIASDSEEGLSLAKRYPPKGIVANLGLAQLDGWRMLDLLKHDRALRHIPVQVIASPEQGVRAMQRGAAAFTPSHATAGEAASSVSALVRIIERPKSKLLVIEDNDIQLKALVELLSGEDVEITAAVNGEEALGAVAKTRYDCIVLDLGLPDVGGTELIERIRSQPDHETVPVVIYTGKALTRPEEAELAKLTDSIIIKDAKSPERLLDETSLHLHRPESAMSDLQRKMMREIESSDPLLEGKKVLIVDDDMRNIFALASALERYGIEVAYAENGRDAIERITSQPSIDAVLMDIMMPEMDGYETMRRIRAEEKFTDLPIIALTAKAMKGDRERCLEAGASDYITKPVDVPQLLSLLRVNLYI